MDTEQAEHVVRGLADKSLRARAVISGAERLQLLGIMVLARSYNEKLSDLIKVGLAITGEKDADGLTADAVYSSGYGARDVDELLKSLDITVQG